MRQNRGIQMRQLVPSGTTTASPCLISTVVVFGVAACLGGCGQHETAEVKPGQPDYPTLNPNPSHVVQFLAIVPATLSVDFGLTYGASPIGKSCQREVGLAVTVPLYLGIPLQLTSSGESYRGQFAIDQFNPGGCDWSFVGVGSSVKGSVGGAAVVSHDGRSFGVADVHLDIWCVKIPHPVDPKLPEICGNLSSLESFQGAVSPQFVTTVPANERGSGSATFIGLNAETITVRFHDIDAMRSR